MKFARTLILLTATAIGLLATGCAEDVGEIDRVQANYVEKKDFGGVWYEMAIVTAMPTTASFGFVGLMNFGDKEGKILFDVQEKYLIVYPYTETVLGGDAKWNKRKVRKYWDDSVRNRAGNDIRDDDFIEVVTGNPTAIYPIISHFDIKRDYSPTTGAQSNVRIENTTDRPWWKRDHMRVDWMGNLLTNVMFPQGSMKYSPVDYYVSADEKDNPNRFYMAKSADGKAEGYFHFTRRMFGAPLSPAACSPYSLAIADCAGAEFDVRISYKRASTKRLNDYEVLPYHNSGPQSKFGFFLAERYRWDEDYGLTYTGHDYKAARWNIWMNSKKFELPRDDKGVTLPPVACQTNRDCAEPQVCDQPDFFTAGQCKVGQRVDYTKRDIRPIIYHLSVDQPVDHVPAEYETADAWSDVFKETVSWLRFWEQKWSADIKTGPIGFTDAQSKFGQRFCSTHADCSQHALAQVLVDTKSQPANRVVIAAGDAAKVETIVVEDCLTAPDPVTKDMKCSDRPAMVAGDAYVAFVNASPGVAKATLTGLPTPIADVPYKTGLVAAKDHAVVVPKSALATVSLEVDVGGKKIAVPNVRIAGGDGLIVVLTGGDNIVVLRGKGTKTGLRLVHGVATKTAKFGDQTVSDGETLEVGVNGTRAQANLAYGKASEFLYFTTNQVHAVFLRPGSRGDVSCLQESGRGICTGWRQELTAADEVSRAQIKSTLQDVFVLCENKFTATKAKCGADAGKREVLNDCRYWTQVGGKDFNPCADLRDNGLVAHAAEAKIGGDSRYNFMYWVTNMEPTSPLGYGPAAPDPDTGEIQWATANVYGASLITYAQYAKDIVDLLNGDLKTEDLATGKYIKDYVEAQSQTQKDKTLFGAMQIERSPAEQTEWAKSEATVRMLDRAVIGQGVRPTIADEKMIHDLESPANVKAWLNKNQPTFDMNQVFARLDKIKGTPLERAMINDEVALVMSEGQVQPGDEISPEMLGKISPTGWATPKRQMEEKRRMQLLGVNSIELAEFNDPAVIGLAQRMKCQPGQTPTTDWTKINDNSGKLCFKGDALRTALSVALFAATIEHEVGHTIGLRHNFEGSTDLVNFFDGYFDAVTGREKEAVLCAELTNAAGTVKADDFCESDSFGETCVFAKCKGNADCPSGLACDKSQCIDKDGVAVGTCHGATPNRIACTADKAEATCGPGTACAGGWCASKVACTADSKCNDGETCQDGKFCVDVRSQLPRTTLLLDDKQAELKQYVPRPGLTANEQKNRRTEYQYSTVMDYGQKINSDVLSLGKYDYAAIKFGYGEMVEVFSDTTFLSDQTHRFAKNRSTSFESVSWKMDTAGWSGIGTVTPALDIVNRWMPPDFNKKRETVPSFLVDLERHNTSKFSRNDADHTYFEVPYKYCSDEFRGNQGCYYFDTGASPEEIVYHASEAITEYYLFDAFKRERLWFSSTGSPSGYMARIQDRWLLPLGNAGRFYALFNNIYRIYPWFNYFEHSTYQMNPLRRASEAAFNKLASMVTAPAPGSYEKSALTGTYVNKSYEPGKASVDIPLGEAKYPWTTFATNQGYYYYSHPLWIGGYWDKVAAIGTLTNSSANFLSDFLGEQLPLFRGTAIGFNTVYPKQLASLLGGVAAGDVQEIGGTFDPQGGGYRPHDYFKPTSNTLDRVEPSVLNHSLRLLAAWQAIANLPAGFDPEFADSMSLWLKGNGKQFEVGTAEIGKDTVGIQKVEFEDPFGKKTYVALRPNYDADRYSPTFRMLQRLNLLKTGCADGSVCTVAAGGQATCTGGVPCSKTWYTKATGSERNAMAETIKKEVEVIDYFRMLYGLYGDISTQ